MPGFIFIIAPGFNENNDKLELTILLTRITFPFLFFVSLSSFFSAVLNSHNKFANDIFNLLFLALFFLVLLIEIFMPIFVGVIAPGFVEDTKKFELATALTRITFPFLMFVSLSSFFGAILNSHNKFAAVSAEPII